MLFGYRSVKPFGPELDMPDSILAAMWERANWDVAEHMLQNYQQQLAVAAKHRQKETIRTLQRCITDSIEIKMLAVNKLTQHKPSPGVDGVWWRTPAEKMRGAIGLRHEFYRATQYVNFL